MLSKFFGKHIKVNLLFRTESLPGDQVGLTYPIGAAGNPYTDRIIISIDPNKAANRPDVMIAKTIIHELIHASIERLIHLYQAGIASTDDGKSLNALIAYYKKFPMANPKFNIQDWEHGYMVQHYLATIGIALKEFDNNPNIPLCFYKMLAWEGLYTTPYWTKLDPAKSSAINNAILNYKNSQIISPCIN